ncbi:MAG: Zn-ribbon domain-containing OB-fold protein [Acidimicrobiales bacterium]
MSARLLPPVSDLTLPYWDAARNEQLVVQFCRRCEHRPFPPRTHCPACGAGDLDWRTVSGTGIVHTFTVAHRPPHPVFADLCPLVIAIVELTEGPRLLSNVVNCDPADVHVGMALSVTFEAVDDSDVRLPVFTPATADASTG